MNDIDDAELIVRLNELLEAERAGARVALESARDVESAALSDLMRAVQADEARWCAMRHRAIVALGATPSPTTGAFYGKAMAIGDSRERLAFLDRGQGWVVRELHVVLPQLRDDALPLIGVKARGARRDTVDPSTDNTIRRGIQCPNQRCSMYGP